VVLAVAAVAGAIGFFDAAVIANAAASMALLTLVLSHPIGHMEKRPDIAWPLWIATLLWTFCLHWTLMWRTGLPPGQHAALFVSIIAATAIASAACWAISRRSGGTP
jgi:acid phosphatase family membrane protein YuiD